MSAGPFPSENSPKTRRIGGKEAAIPMEVVILTADHEVQGIIHVSRDAREERRISDLLNDPDRRFLAVTDAKLINRNGPSSPRIYSFMQLHIDNIIMVHPSAQAVLKNTEYSKDEALRFDELRSKMVRTMGQPSAGSQNA
ncbi:DUF6812 domain-containing protein [Vampirovibrio chlorellavorus]|uniref:DUF6812 domain-containing protein n=1 Tax=Vampirovibrio chlorellavorus TaxID=758823 RepID=UPI0026EE6337|nr:hypothetical protein [Vampirovibrio chlorellavorus]